MALTSSPALDPDSRIPNLQQGNFKEIITILFHDCSTCSILSGAPGFHYSSMSNGGGNQGSYYGNAGNGYAMGQYSGQGMASNGMFSQMSSGMQPMQPIPPMQPLAAIQPMPGMLPMGGMPKFEWWPSIFDTHKKDRRK